MEAMELLNLIQQN